MQKLSPTYTNIIPNMWEHYSQHLKSLGSLKVMDEKREDASHMCTQRKMVQDSSKQRKHSLRVNLTDRYLRWRVPYLAPLPRRGKISTHKTNLHPLHTLIIQEFCGYTCWIVSFPLPHRQETVTGVAPEDDGSSEVRGSQRGWHATLYQRSIYP